MRNEVKVGIFAALSLFIMIWGYNFLKGKNLFSGDILLYAKFDNVDGLNVAAPVTINGLQIGVVTDIIPDDNYKGILVSMNIKKDSRVPKTARATLRQPSLMGGKVVSLEFEAPCNGNCITKEEVTTLDGTSSGMMADVLEVADPYLESVDTILQAIKHLSQDEQNNLSGTFQELKQVVTNVRQLTDLLNILMAASTKNLNGTFANLNSITANIKESNDQIKLMLDNLTALSTQLKETDIKGTVGEAKNTLNTITTTVDNLKGTMDKVNGALDNVNRLLDFSKQDGLVAALFDDKGMKVDVEKTLKNLDLLLEDIREHPERYRTVLSGKYKPYKKD